MSTNKQEEPFIGIIKKILIDKKDIVLKLNDLEKLWYDMIKKNRPIKEIRFKVEDINIFMNRYGGLYINGYRATNDVITDNNSVKEYIPFNNITHCQNILRINLRILNKLKTISMV